MVLLVVVRGGEARADIQQIERAELTVDVDTRVPRAAGDTSEDVPVAVLW